jgi:hypothetical protein
MNEELSSTFVATNPIGASLTTTPGHCINDHCTVEAHVSGFGERKEYLLFCANTGDAQEPVAFYPLTIEGNTIIEHARGHEIKKNSFSFTVGAYPGFRSTWYLWALDDSIRLAQHVTPCPLQVVGSDGAIFYIVRKETGGNIVDIFASGLTPGEQICFVFRSMDEEFVYPGKVPETGKIHYPCMSSFVGLKQGVLSGQTTVLLVREREVLELSFDWDLSTTKVAATK